MISASDQQYMKRALELAELGWGRVTPNPLVGAVVVRNGTIVGEGYHAEYGAAHAESAALGAAGSLARGATLYVTLEPCNHTGRTPPCTTSIMDAGIARVVYATRDPNPVAAGGTERLRSAGITVDSGLLEQEAMELNAPFLMQFRRNRPWVILKLAVSLDDAIADHARSRGWITSELARMHVHRMRAGVDAVGVGLGTVAADDPALTVRGSVAPRVPPVRVVFSRKSVLSADAVLSRTASALPTWLVTEARHEPALDALEALGVRIIPAQDLTSALMALSAQGLRSILVEGGARVAASFLNEGLADRLTIFRAPIILGSGSLKWSAAVKPSLLSEARRLPIVEHRMFGDDSMTTFAITRLL